MAFPHLFRWASERHGRKRCLLQYKVPDAPLTALGRSQAAGIAPATPELQNSVNLIVSSPLKRTLQTTLLGWHPAIERLGGRSAIICLPEAQECNAHPCDTGSVRSALEQDPELAGLDLSRLSDEWTSKRGFWAEDRADAVPARARWVRQWLFARPEHEIVLVAHGDILRQIMGSEKGESEHAWKNAEVRVFKFEEGAKEGGPCWLLARGG
nr:hypothetical protein CFP56_31744 [Quercus suber]